MGSSNTDNLSLALHIVGATEVVSALKTVAASGNLIGMAAAGIGVVSGAIAGLGIEAIRAAAEHEHLAVKMKAIFGAQQGDAALKWAESLAAGTAGAVYSVEELGAAILRLRSQGLNPTEFMPALMETGAALGQDAMERVASIFTRIKQLNSFGGRQILAFMGTGIDLNKILNEQLGISVQQLRAMGQAGISAAVALPALTKGLSKQFGGTMGDWANTFDGAMNQIRTKIGLIMETAGAPLLRSIVPVLERINAAFKDPKMWSTVAYYMAWLIAGFQTAWTVGSRIMASIFDGKPGLPRWLAEIGDFMLRLVKLAIVTKAIMEGANMGAAIGSLWGPLGYFAGGMIGAMGGVAAGAIAGAVLDDQRKKMWSKVTPNSPGISNLTAGLDIADKQHSIQADLQKNFKAFLGGMSPPNLSVAPNEGSAGGGFSKTLERFFVGGGDFAKKWGRMAPYGMGPGSAPLVKVQVNVGKGGTMDKAMAEAVTLILNAVLVDRGVLSALKARLASA